MTVAPIPPDQPASATPSDPIGEAAGQPTTATASHAAGFGADAIHVRGLRLWAHVGVLERERLLGQWFELDLTLWWPLATAGRADALALSLDYGVAIQALQRLARELRCLTLEAFAEQMLDLIERLYGPVPLRLELRKCRAPVPGFSGSVAVERWRYLERIGQLAAPPTAPAAFAVAAAPAAAPAAAVSSSH